MNSQILHQQYDCEVLTIFYSIFYSKVVYYTKRFKIQKELAIIFKMSTTILVFI